jgi:hypothetical protein
MTRVTLNTHFVARWAERGNGGDGTDIFWKVYNDIKHKRDDLIEHVFDIEHYTGKVVRQRSVWRFVRQGERFYAIVDRETQIPITVVSHGQFRYYRHMRQRIRKGSPYVPRAEFT